MAKPKDSLVHVLEIDCGLKVYEICGGQELKDAYEQWTAGTDYETLGIARLTLGGTLNDYHRTPTQICVSTDAIQGMQLTHQL